MGYNWQQNKMKRFLIIIVGFMLCSWLTSCYTNQLVPVSNQEVEAIWKGQPKKNIIYKFGPPTRETSDGDNGTILVYEYNVGSNTTTKTTYNQYDNTKREQSNTNYVNEHVWFYLNSEGVCVGVRNNHFKKQERVYDSRATIALVCGLVIPVAVIAIALLGAKASGVM